MLIAVPTICLAQNFTRAKIYYDNNLFTDSKRELVSILLDETASSEIKKSSLFLIGQIAFEEKNYKSSLVNWQNLIKQFPESEEAKKVSKEIGDVKRLYEQSLEFVDRPFEFHGLKSGMTIDEVKKVLFPNLTQMTLQKYKRNVKFMGEYHAKKSLLKFLQSWLSIREFYDGDEKYSFSFIRLNFTPKGVLWGMDIRYPVDEEHESFSHIATRRVLEQIYDGYPIKKRTFKIDDDTFHVLQISVYDARIREIGIQEYMKEIKKKYQDWKFTRE